MSNERQNCWEALNCGRENQCPAYPDQGRICFSVKGTHCRGEVQGSYMEKIKSCENSCSFYGEINK